MLNYVDTNSKDVEASRKNILQHISNENETGEYCNGSLLTVLKPATVLMTVLITPNNQLITPNNQLQC